MSAPTHPNVLLSQAFCGFVFRSLCLSVCLLPFLVGVGKESIEAFSSQTGELSIDMTFVGFVAEDGGGKTTQ